GVSAPFPRQPAEVDGLSVQPVSHPPAVQMSVHGRVGTAFWWALLILVGGLALPWSRQGANVLAYDAARTGLRLLGQAWPIALAFALAAALLLLGRQPVPARATGRAMLGLAALGAAVTLAQLFMRGEPFGLGAIIVFLGFVSIAGISLS